MVESATQPRVKWVPALRWLEEHREEINLGTYAFYQAIEKGEIPSLRVGRRLFVRKDALEVMAERQGAGA